MNFYINIRSINVELIKYYFQHVIIGGYDYAIQYTNFINLLKNLPSKDLIFDIKNPHC
jgi:hypothetical protein